MKELIVSAIDTGTVIDHIPAKSVMQVVRILGLEDFENMILIGTNFDSKKLIKKGIIKVKGKFFKPETINKIALVAPQATLTIIEDYNVKNKTIVEVPEEIIGIVQCPNQNCITNHEEMNSEFFVVDKTNGIKLKCHFCEKTFGQEEMKIL
ncbi:MAG: aspartate carbamoyltransferase regulatory subunit [Bacteroidetes bacterium]|nr:aspartate carbamoyltransferase regulatory subunit [Bacteroidota bacterium]